MRRTSPLLIASCWLALVVVVGWGSSVEAWSTGAGGDPNWGSTTLGGTSDDYGYSVAVDGSG
ncbi:MAG TPA: hypothetical protein QF409_09245, partial [Acidimicrobiales bacterium]|nr:hypothetical protein [Acidimicrobiales bacterium]